MINVNNWPLQDKEKIFAYLGSHGFCSERYKLLYVVTPKVACTSLKWWFAEMEGYAQALRENINSAETDPDLTIHSTFSREAPHVTGLSPEALLAPLTSDAYFRFAVVRNPYKRIFSAWQSKLLLREPLQVAPYLNCAFFNQPIGNSNDLAKAFEGFLVHLAANEAPDYWDIHWTPQVRLLRPDLIEYTKLFKIENAKELSTALAEWIGPQFVDPFASRNANESLIPYQPEFISARSAELIQTLYAEDFATLGYSNQPPGVNEIFSAEQLEVALKAIEIIRGRHQRLSEMSVQIVTLNQALYSRVAEIKKIYASRSWRVTRPLRILTRLMREKN